MHAVAFVTAPAQLVLSHRRRQVAASCLQTLLGRDDVPPACRRAANVARWRSNDRRHRKGGFALLRVFVLLEVALLLLLLLLRQRTDTRRRRRVWRCERCKCGGGSVVAGAGAIALQALRLRLRRALVLLREEATCTFVAHALLALGAEGRASSAVVCPSPAVLEVQRCRARGGAATGGGARSLEGGGSGLSRPVCHSAESSQARQGGGKVLLAQRARYLW